MKKKKKKNPIILLLPLGVCLALLSVLFLSATMIVVVGMVPTVVVFLTGRRGQRSKALTVGAMNMAGCFIFLRELAQHNYTMEKGLEIIVDPFTIVIIFMAAAIGYVIDWGISNVASSILYQRSVVRKETIEKKKVELVERWGDIVTGDIELDDSGFPYDP